MLIVSNNDFYAWKKIKTVEMNASNQNVRFQKVWFFDWKC